MARTISVSSLAHAMTISARAIQVTALRCGDKAHKGDLSFNIVTFNILSLYISVNSKRNKNHVANLESKRKDIFREQENFDKIKNRASELQAFVFVTNVEDIVAVKTKSLG